MLSLDKTCSKSPFAKAGEKVAVETDLGISEKNAKLSMPTVEVVVVAIATGCKTSDATTHTNAKYNEMTKISMPPFIF